MPSMDPESLKQPGAVEAMMAAQKGASLFCHFVRPYSVLATGELVSNYVDPSL